MYEIWGGFRENNGQIYKKAPATSVEPLGSFGSIDGRPGHDSAQRPVEAALFKLSADFEAT